MGLKADLDEVLHAWPQWPWRLRLFLVVSLFLSSASLASLSEAVIKWKGFILDGIAFFRTYLSFPIAHALESLFGIVPPKNAIESTILVSVVFVTGFRLELLRSKTTKARAVRALTLTINFFFLAALLWFHSLKLWFAALAILIAIYVANRQPGAERILGLVYLVSPFLILCILAAINVGLNKT